MKVVLLSAHVFLPFVKEDQETREAYTFFCIACVASWSTKEGGDALHVLAPILVFYFYKPCISSIIEGCQTKSKMISWNCGALLPEIYNEDTISGVYWTGPLKQVKCSKNSLCHKWGRRMAYLQKNCWGIIVAQNYHNLLPCNCSQTWKSWKFGILVNENPRPIGAA